MSKIILKTDFQIRQIKKSCDVTSNTLFYLKELIKPGISTNEINAKAEEFIRKAGAIPAALNYGKEHLREAFPKSICTSINEVICHGIPNDKEILKEGDIISVDVATILNSYFGDACFTFPVGQISDAAKHLLITARKCLDEGIAECKPNVHFGNIGHKINKCAVENRCSAVYQFVGHGVGIDFHEEPKVQHIALPGSGPLMKPRMIFTIEPMINQGKAEVDIDIHDAWTARTIDRKLSAQYEHTVLITETGHEILTKLPELEFSEGTNYLAVDFA